MARFGRVLVAMVTPFREDGSVDVDEAQRLATHLLSKGADGILVSGSTGESATLTDEEKVTLFRAVKDAVSDAPVIAGSGTYSTEHSIELTRAAEKAGCDGVLAVTPYYNKPPQDALLDHFRAIADASNLPVMLYDIPGRTATKIAVDTLLRAAEHPRIVAVKEAAGDITAITNLSARKPDDFEIYCGQDNWTLALQAIGAAGVVSVAGHIVADRIAAQFRAAVDGDFTEARRIQLEIDPLLQALFCTTNPIPLKAAMRMLGFEVGDPRPPLRAATAEEESTVRQALEQLGAL